VIILTILDIVQISRLDEAAALRTQRRSKKTVFIVVASTLLS